MKRRLLWLFTPPRSAYVMARRGVLQLEVIGDGMFVDPEAIDLHPAYRPLLGVEALCSIIQM
jgi:hypothetical protein